MSASHRPPRGELAPRDANESAFSIILEQLLRGLPASYGCAFVDDEGECIEYVGAVDPFHIKIAGARLRIVLSLLDETRALGHAHRLVVRGSKESLLVQRVMHDYALVVLFSRGGGFLPAPRALAVAERQIAEECGQPHLGERWYPAHFSLDAQHKPHRWHGSHPSEADEGVEIVGAVVGLGRGEEGFRLRTRSGAEVTAIREASRMWYTDDRCSL